MASLTAAKYQFSIFEYNKSTNNSAATKAVMDCSVLFTQKGYQNRMITFNNNSKRGFNFYLSAFSGLCKFLLTIKRGSLVGIQYPMLNNVFKYFIIAARIKKIKFFCIVHDIESLRLGAKDEAAVAKECANLNFYNGIIVHNHLMQRWLASHGVKTQMLALEMFDYLVKTLPEQPAATFAKSVVYAGNLSKSKFVYLLKHLPSWKFNLYGPNYIETEQAANTYWNGVFSPSEVVYKLQGDFGLIWDGDRIDGMDDILGNYLNYNNPHKFSLYVAAGLPVIAPAGAAIAAIIERYQIGILVNSLYDLQQIDIDLSEYNAMKNNVRQLQEKVTQGYFFSTALDAVEKQILSDR
jgi:hypothetical protein